VSGYATQWYLHAKSGEISYWTSAKLLIKFHWGSVIGGSIFLGVFYFFDYLFDLFDVITGGSEQKRANQADNSIY
jgi:hypothetical protein